MLFFSSKGVDFPNYFTYIEYFIYGEDIPVNNQGLLYYFLNALVVFARKEDLNSINSIVFFNSTIQLTNFLFYLLGTFGLFKLLKSFNFKTNTILISLTLMHWTPKIIEMRIIMKPEIIAFALLPWIILGIDNYFINNNTKVLFLSLFPLALLVTSKGSIAGMILVFIFLKYVKRISKKNIKQLLFFLILFLLLCLGVGYENYSFYGSSFFDITVSSDYENQASIGFLTNLNILDLIFSPKLGYHNESFLGITLLDLFGDYYMVNLGSEDNYFVYNQTSIYQNSAGEDLTRNYIELIFAITFLFLVFKIGNKNKRLNVIVFSPIIGIFILLMNAYGIPSMNFNPLMGDTMKASYYSFFISLSLVFLISELIDNKSDYLKIFSILLIFPMIFLLGFPKSNYSDIADNIDTKIELSFFCEPISLLVKSTTSDDCNNKIKKNCEYNLYSNEAQIIKIFSEEEVPDGFTSIYRKDTILREVVPNEELDKYLTEGGYSLTPVLGFEDLKYINPLESLLLKKDENFIYTDDITECTKLLSDGYLPFNNIKFDNSKIPFINILYFIVSIFFIVSLSKKNKSL